MTKYKYEIKRFKELATNLQGAPEKWVAEKMNEIGASGSRVMGPPIEFNEPSTVAAANGAQIPYYGIIVFVETIVSELPPEPSSL